MDRREHKRDNIEKEACLTINDKTIDSYIHNISQSGALFAVDIPGTSQVTSNDIGLEIGIQYSEQLNGRYPTKGRIIRITEKTDELYIAIFFL